MPPSAVVDASVLVSAFLFPNSVPGRLIELAGQRYTLHLSCILVEEVSRALHNARLKRSYRHSDEAAIAWCAELAKIGTTWTSLPEIGPVCRDPDDDHVIAAALAAEAGWIVTGDRDLLDLGRYRRVRIVTARSFLHEILGD